MKIFAKSRTISLITGLFLLIMILPGVVSAYSTSSVNAQVISTTIPSSMTAGQSYPVSITMKNTGSMAWNEESMIRLGGIGDNTGDAALFSQYRMRIPAGTSVISGDQYTFTFTMTAPATPGYFVPKYRMVWDGHEWFGTWVTKTIQVVSRATAVPVSESDSVTSNSIQTMAAAGVPPKAQFTSNVTQGSSPLFVQFTDQSTGTGPLTYHWNFGDGDYTIPETTMKNPVWHFWKEYGTSFTVTLTVKNAYGSDTIVKQNYVTLGTSSKLTVTPTPTPTSVPTQEPIVELRRAPSAQFTASSTQGKSPLTVQFTDKSVTTGTTLYKWDVNNDGKTDYTTKNPSHTFTAAGSYSVKLIVSNAYGSDTEVKTNYITVSSKGTNPTPTPTPTPAPTTTPAKLPAAQFIASTTQGTPPLTVQFTDKSVSAGTTSYAWDINNDGVADYTTKNPSHTYTAAGTYTVKLTVTNSSGSDSEIKNGYITATSTPVIVGNSEYGAESNPTGYAIGGGAGYPTYSAATSTYTVKTVTEFKNLMVGGSKPATAGQVVFIPSGTTLDLSGQNSITIPAGVTIASDRGYNGAAGGKIKKYSGSGYSMLTVGGNNVRVTGLVLEGPNPAPETLNYLVMGILNYGGYSGLVVDNNEIWGWSYAGVFSNGAPTSGRPLIHHNYIHHNQGDGYGYGVNVNGGDALVEANLFDYNRHTITGGGLVGEKYEFRYNIHLGHGSVVGGTHVDVHENEQYPNNRVACAGSEYLIHHNTINQGSGTAQQAFVHIRDVPQKGAYIYNNLINTNWGSGTNNDGAQSVIYQSCDYSNHFGGVYATKNMWKGTLYPTNTGIVWEQYHA